MSDAPYLHFRIHKKPKNDELFIWLMANLAVIFFYLIVLLFFYSFKPPEISFFAYMHPIVSLWKVKCASFLMLIGINAHVFETRKNYEPYEKDFGHFPRYVTYQAVVTANLEFSKVYKLCLYIIPNISKFGHHVLEDKQDIGFLKIQIRDLEKHTRDFWIPRFNVLEFQFLNKRQNLLEIKISAYNQALLKGFKSHKNLKDLYALHDQLKQTLEAEGVAVTFDVAEKDAPLPTGVG